MFRPRTPAVSNPFLVQAKEFGVAVVLPSNFNQTVDAPISTRKPSLPTLLLLMRANYVAQVRSLFRAVQSHLDAKELMVLLFLMPLLIAGAPLGAKGFELENEPELEPQPAGRNIFAGVPLTLTGLAIDLLAEGAIFVGDCAQTLGLAGYPRSTPITGLSHSCILI